MKLRAPRHGNAQDSFDVHGKRERLIGRNELRPAVRVSEVDVRQNWAIEVVGTERRADEIEVRGTIPNVAIVVVGDQYFDDGMVMADDEKLRNNRLSMLVQLRTIFLEVADFSRLQS